MQQQSGHITRLEVNEAQRLYIWFGLGFLTDVVVLNLANEFWVWVSIPSFLNTLRLALLVEVALTLAFHFRRVLLRRAGESPTKLRQALHHMGGAVTVILIKGVVFAIVLLVLSGHVYFEGPLQGAVAFLVTVLMILSVEWIIKCGFHMLKDPPQTEG